ncbi:MAG: hypothetical protein ACRDX9_14795 [Acidimicrobiia bacterium]
MTAIRSIPHLNVGSAYLVNGILHDYLGPAIAPDSGGRVHAFRRREWRPNTPDQLLVSLVAEDAVEGSVTRFGARHHARSHDSRRRSALT